MVHRSLAPLLPFAAVLVTLAGCASSNSSYLESPAPQQPRHPTPAGALHGEGDLYLVPIGNVPPSMLRDLQTYFNGKYGLSIKVTAPVPVPRSAVDMRRRQLIADPLLNTVVAHDPQPESSIPATLIGITTLDMYSSDTPSWRYVFSFSGGNACVISTARMDPKNYGYPPDPTLLESRVRKMVAKKIGLLYYHLHESSDPRSVLYGNIMGPDDLDRVDGDF